MVEGINTPLAPRVLVFMSSHGRDVLATCPVWFVDGTFKAVEQTLFKQIVFIIGMTEMGQAVTCGFALLPSKERDAYLRVAETLHDELRETPHVALRTIMMDFERGFINAFSDTFPGVTVVGCEFHFKSCIRKHIANLGLIPLYNDDHNFTMLVRYIWSMVYVPEEEIINFWENEIKAWVVKHAATWEKDYEKEVQQFLRYIDQTWIGELNTRTKQRKRPLFAHSLWNKYKAVKAGDMRTNNVVEGYNHAFSLSLPSRATEWTVIDRFKVEESTSKTILHQAAIENDTGESIRNRAKEKRDRDLQLQNLIKNCPNLTRQAYLESLVTFIK